MCFAPAYLGSEVTKVQYRDQVNHASEISVFGLAETVTGLRCLSLSTPTLQSLEVPKVFSPIHLISPLCSLRSSHRQHWFGGASGICYRIQSSVP